MPRKIGYWNYLPKAVYTGDESISALEVLTAWGVQDWGQTSPFFESQYVGWCRVHLPDGWQIALEEYNFYLLDHHGQVRGEIFDAFVRNKRRRIDITAEDIAEAGISPEEWSEAFPPNETRKEPERPQMVLRTAIFFRESMNGAGDHTLRVEDPAGNDLFAIYDEPISPDEYNEKLTRLAERILDWLDTNYPDHADFTAYWDMFVAMDARWSLPQDDIMAVAASLLADKTDDELRDIWTEMGNGEAYTNYLLTLQQKLKQMNEQTDETPPFYIASRVASMMRRIITSRTGLEED